MVQISQRDAADCAVVFMMLCLCWSLSLDNCSGSNKGLSVECPREISTNP